MTLKDDLLRQNQSDRERKARKELQDSLEIATLHFEIEKLKRTIPTRATMILLASWPVPVN